MLVAVVQDAQQFVHLPVHGTKYRQHHPVITGRADKNRMHSAVGLLTDWEFLAALRAAGCDVAAAILTVMGNLIQAHNTCRFFRAPFVHKIPAALIRCV